MSDVPEVFSLLAELALALAGFSGVAAAFSGRDRSYRPTEYIRLISLFHTSGTVFVCSGFVYVFLLAEFSPSQTFRTASLLVTVIFASVGIPFTIKAYRAAQAPDSSSEAWALHLNSFWICLVLGLTGINIVFGQLYLLLASLWLIMTYGIWMFFRFLTRAN